MYQHFDSPTGVRFLAFVKEGKSFRESVRLAGVGKETGYRWLRDEYLQYRSEGLDHVAAQNELGFISRNAEKWNERFLSGYRAPSLPSRPSRRGNLLVLLLHRHERIVCCRFSRRKAYDWIPVGLPSLHHLAKPAASDRGCKSFTAVPGDLRQMGNPAERRTGSRKSTSAESRAGRHWDREDRCREGGSSLVTSTKATRFTGDTILGLGELRCFNAAACRMLGVSRVIGTRLRNQRAEQPRASLKPPRAGTCACAKGFIWRTCSAWDVLYGRLAESWGGMRRPSNGSLTGTAIPGGATCRI